MRYVHTMVRVKDLDASLDFYCTKFGLEEIRRVDRPEGKFTLVFLAAPQDAESAKETRAPELELTYNWGSEEDYQTGRSWGHLAYKVDDIYALEVDLERHWANARRKVEHTVRARTDPFAQVASVC